MPKILPVSGSQGVAITFTAVIFSLCWIPAINVPGKIFLPSIATLSSKIDVHLSRQEGLVPRVTCKDALRKQISPIFSYFLINNALLYHAISWRIDWLTKRKWLRNLFFAKLPVLKWRHNHSQFPVFGPAVLYPTGSEISRFWYVKTRGKKITSNNLFYYIYQYIVEILSSK